VTYAGTLLALHPSEFADAPIQQHLCLACERDWEHCHDAMVVHSAADAECTDSACRLASQLHGLTVDCAQLQPPCRCGE
jgi:hypothetical protein